MLDDVSRVLLGRRAKDPNRGKWIIPGGGVRFGERWRDAAVREILEETGLFIKVPADVNPHVYEILDDDEHRVILYLVAREPLGEAKAASDLSEVQYFAESELPEDMSPHAAPVLRLVLGWKL